MPSHRYILAEMGQCAEVLGCQHAPQAISHASQHIAHNTTHTITANNQQQKRKALPALRDFSSHLAQATHDVCQQGHFPVILGGDHSCAIGTWSGIIQYHHAIGKDDFGLIWLDAHLDSHTPDTSLTGNLHGTPMATLLGYGDEHLCYLGGIGAKIKPENVAFMGIRSFEKAEQNLVQSLGIPIYTARHINRTGFYDCLQQVVTSFQNRNIPFGISFDMDVLDPEHIKAVGTPVQGGVCLQHVLHTLKTIDLKGLKALEIVEYNPTLDKTGQDCQTVLDILGCFDTAIPHSPHRNKAVPKPYRQPIQ